MVYKSGQIFLPFCHNSRVWRTDRQTEFSSQYRVCITCSAVKTKSALNCGLGKVCLTTYLIQRFCKSVETILWRQCYSLHDGVFKRLKVSFVTDRHRGSRNHAWSGPVDLVVVLFLDVFISRGRSDAFHLIRQLISSALHISRIHSRRHAVLEVPISPACFLGRSYGICAKLL